MEAIVNGDAPGCAMTVGEEVAAFCSYRKNCLGCTYRLELEDRATQKQVYVFRSARDGRDWKYPRWPEMMLSIQQLSDSKYKYLLTLPDS